jgi:hypothetical protein
MRASEVSRAVVASMSVASSLDLTVEDVIVLHNSNRLTVRLLPCDVLARVAPVAHQVAQFEVELAQRLAESECPVAPRFWTEVTFPRARQWSGRRFGLECFRVTPRSRSSGWKPLTVLRPRNDPLSTVRWRPMTGRFGELPSSRCMIHLTA